MWNDFAPDSLRNSQICLRQTPYCHSLRGFPLEGFDLCSNDDRCHTTAQAFELSPGLLPVCQMIATELLHFSPTSTTEHLLIITSIFSASDPTFHAGELANMNKPEICSKSSASNPKLGQTWDNSKQKPDSIRHTIQTLNDAKYSKLIIIHNTRYDTNVDVEFQSCLANMFSERRQGTWPISV